MSISSRQQEVTADDAARLLDDLTALVARASAAILAKPYSQTAHRVKDDQSPVTELDEAAEAIILEGLAKLLPGVPVIAEESVARAPTHVEASCIIVDPLDGTKEFIGGRDEYTVNIGIATRGTPVAGIISAPAQGLAWRGIVGRSAERLRMSWHEAPSRAERTPIRTRRAPSGLVAATSRSHLDPASEAFLSRLSVERRYQCGSSVKFCHVAQGDADIYPRLAPTREWDIAAGCAILAAAGGLVTDPGGGPLRFGNASAKFLVPGFIAWGDPEAARQS